MSTPTMAEIFEKIEDLETKVDKAKETESSNGGSSLWGWLVGLVLAAAIAIGAFFLLRNLKKKNEELAKLRTKTEQDEVRKANLQHDAEVAKHTEKAAELRAKAADLEETIRLKRARIRATQTMYDQAAERIIHAKNWKELEALNEEGR